MWGVIGSRRSVSARDWRFHGFAGIIDGVAAEGLELRLEVWLISHRAVKETQNCHRPVPAQLGDGVPCAGAPFDASGNQAVDVEPMANQFQHLHFFVCQNPIRSGHFASQRVAGFAKL